MARLDYDRTWQDLSLVPPPTPAWESIPEYPKGRRKPDRSMPRTPRPLVPKERKPDEPPHWAFYKAFRRLPDDEMLERWPEVLEELNGIYTDVLRFDEKWSTSRKDLRATLDEIRALIERRVKLAARAKLAAQ